MKHHYLTRTAFGSAITGTLFVIISVWTADHRFGETGGMLMCLAVLLWVVSGIIYAATEDARDTARVLAVSMVENAHTNLHNAKGKS